MNVYDFDDTIYNGDSTIDFYLFCIKKKPQLIRYIFKQVYGIALYKLKMINKTKMKEYFFSFLKGIENIDDFIDEFWNKHIGKIKKWYRLQQQEDDVIISASPYFLLKVACDNLDIKHLIASEVNKKDGSFETENCYGEEKVKRFHAMFQNEIDAFYSDSYSDRPMAEIAKQAYFVKKKKCTKWKFVED